MKKHGLFKILNNKGVGAIGQAIVLSGMLGGMALTYNILSENQAKSVKGMQQDLEIDTITNEITTLLSDSATCLLNLNGLNPTGAGAAVNQIRYQTGSSAYIQSFNSTAESTCTNAALANNSGRFTSFYISSMRLGGAAVFGNPGWNAGTGTAYLNIYFYRCGKADGANIVTRQVKVNATVDGGNQVIACNATSGSSGGTGKWTQSGSNIYYNSGFVGIGANTNNASFPLTVAGTAIKNSSGATRFPDGSKQSIAGVWTYHPSTAITYMAGNVGIGETAPSTTLEIGNDNPDPARVLRIGQLYFSGDSGYTFLASNAYYVAASGWIIPDATRRSALLQFQASTGAVGMFQTATAGQGDWGAPKWYYDGTSITVGSGGGTCTTVSATWSGTATYTLNCPAGFWATGGGAYGWCEATSNSYPGSSSSWVCATNGSSTGCGSGWVCYARCCK